MYLPTQNPLSRRQERIEKFGGINRNKVCGDNEFFDTENLCAKGYPALVTAEPVYKLDSIEVGTAGESIFFLDNGIGCITPFREDVPDIYTLIYKGQRITDFEFRRGASLLNCIGFNGKTFIAKDDMAYEFDNGFTSPAYALSKAGYTLNVSATHENPEYNEPTLRLSLLYEDMEEVGNFTTGTQDSDFPTDAQVNDCFALNTEPYRLISKADEENGNDLWQPVTSFRLRLSIGNGYRYFKEGDYIKLDSLLYWRWAVKKLSDLDRFVRIEKTDDEKRYITEPVPVFDGYAVVLSEEVYPTNDIAGYNKPIIDNPGNDLYLLDGVVSACMPELDFICVGANRIWGCNSANHEIYASELGNGRNWSVFEGLAGDSYAVTVGSRGDFTSCCSYLGSPIFFKENEMIIIRGSRPASFSLDSYSVKGVRRDSPMGVCVVGDILYYMTYDGVYAYNGSSSYPVSDSLGDDIRNLSSAVFGGDGNTLYVSGYTDGQPVRYCYDTEKKIWHRRSSVKSSGFIRYPDATLELCGDEEGISYCTLSDIPRDYELTGASLTDTGWMLETGDISYSSHNKKYVRCLSFDARLEGYASLYIIYDNGEKRHISELAPHSRSSLRIRVFPCRCDHFRIRLEGDGRMTLYAITVDVEEAGENG